MDITHTYLEIPALQNRDRAEPLTGQSLQTFQTLHRHNLEADACKVLEKIYARENNLEP